MFGRFKSWLYDERKQARSLYVATTALECDRDPSINRAKMGRMVQSIKAVHPNVELILFGEAITSWYNPRCSEYHRSAAETIPGETTRAMAALAMKHNLYLSFGLSESSAGKLFNSQVLINPAGEIQALHRKKRPESDLFTPGPVPVTITEIKGLRTGIVICADAANPHAMWKMATQRLDLILLSLADDCDPGLFAARFNARMYDAWIVTANRYGDQEEQFWNGHVVISDPMGVLRVVAQEKEQFVVYNITLSSSRSSLPKRLLRNVAVKTPLIPHVLHNWDRARSYL